MSSEQVKLNKICNIQYSSNVAGFYMCCTSSGARRTFSSIASRRLASKDIAQTAVKYAAALKCPSRLLSNGLRCVVNEIEACPTGYVCLGGESIHGVCCKVSLKCTKRRKPYYVVKRQV